MSGKYLAFSFDYQISQARLVKKLTKQNNQLRSLIDNIAKSYREDPPQIFKEHIDNIEETIKKIYEVS